MMPYIKGESTLHYITYLWPPRQANGQRYYYEWRGRSIPVFINTIEHSNGSSSRKLTVGHLPTYLWVPLPQTPTTIITLALRGGTIITVSLDGRGRGRQPLTHHPATAKSKRNYLPSITPVDLPRYHIMALSL